MTDAYTFKPSSNFDSKITISCDLKHATIFCYEARELFRLSFDGIFTIAETTTDEDVAKLTRVLDHPYGLLAKAMYEAAKIQHKRKESE